MASSTILSDVIRYVVLVQDPNLFSVCTCDLLGATNNFCDPNTGHCLCNSNYISGNNCEYCLEGFYGHPNCEGLVNFFIINILTYIGIFFLEINFQIVCAIQKDLWEFLAIKQLDNVPVKITLLV